MAKKYNFGRVELNIDDKSFATNIDKLFETLRAFGLINDETSDPYVTELLKRMADLYAERNAVYKDNYKMVGRVMEALFPEGIVLEDPEEFNRWHLFELAIVKLTRYAIQYNNGGHEDSIEDMIVYLAMVAAIDKANRLAATGDEED